MLLIINFRRLNVLEVDFGNSRTETIQPSVMFHAVLVKITNLLRFPKVNRAA